MPTLGVDDEDALDAATAALRAGELVVLPTDTVYGLAALAGHAGAAQRIFGAKGRPDRLPLPVLASSLDQVRQLGVEIPAAAAALAAQWWPGPLTMAFGFSASAPRPPWLSGRDEVAVRIPQHPFLLALLRRSGPLLVTSANRHGAPTPSAAADAAAPLAAHVALVVDGGICAGAPSTLVNVRGPHPVVEREGAIPAEAVGGALERPA
jgi:L-threonylcarbamoyladenylate synthase